MSVRAQPSTGAPPPRVEIAALRPIRESAQALLAQGQVDEACEVLLSALQAVLVKNRELELLLAKLRRERIGRHSERLDPGQLALLFDVLVGHGGAGPEVDPETLAAEDAALDREIEQAEATHPDVARTRRKTRKKAAGWQTQGVERQLHAVDVPPTDRTCETCQGEMDRIGVDVTRRLEYVPGHFVEHEYHLDKFACGRCKDGVTTAPAPPQVLERSAADASLLAHVVVSKFADHTPLHRLSRIFARSGAAIPVST